ncbi:phosphotransferase [Nonomuraea sp. NEAU-A123]|uniref:phosphotransferase n=1 Tax=Nonomuraea sp. NEAU-A123 TaxID=2839649 RepID=UPI001BE42FB5|nr:phosphotransferase [Nonomuraea sp. NEAU-A123]MBT2231580.1 phosphotransferase [Nonomuraea sp. NEAU-A123]
MTDTVEPSLRETSYPSLPGRGQYTEQARQDLLAWLRTTTNASLRSLEQSTIDPRSLPGNLENFVGVVDIPVGLAGPMLFTGRHAQGMVTAPLATTEGALVASVARGAKAITLAGGVTSQVIAQRMTRAPLFEFAGLGAAAEFARWIVTCKDELDRRVAEVSAHSRLTAVDPVQLGRAVHVRFVYETADAGGQNMTTAATWRACRWINDRLATMPGLAPTWFAIEANLSGDKKFTHLNMISGRGTRVAAECVLDRTTVRRVLKSTPDAIDRLYRHSVLAGQQAGMAGHDIDAANVIAAIFVATGQDIASVYESGTGLFSVDVSEGDIRATLVLPSLVTGVVGGGTRLVRQSDYLDVLGCRGEGHAARFAEIICGFALALNLSTMAAVAGGQFADAHERLGRGRRVNWLSRDDLGAPMLRPMLAQAMDAPGLEVTGVTWIDHTPGSSLITELTARADRRKTTGIFPVRVAWRRDDGDGLTDLLLKVKPLDQEVIIEAAKLASLCGGQVADLYPRWRDWTGFTGLHTRELAVYRHAEPALRAVLPRTYGVHEDAGREAYVIAMERLGPGVLHLDSADTPEQWRPEHLAAAVRGIAGVHTAFLGRHDELRAWLGPVQSAERMTAMRELWGALLEHAATEYPELVDAASARRLRRIVEEIPRWWGRLESMPRTLVHNDFNPRNIALRSPTPHSPAPHSPVTSSAPPADDLGPYPPPDATSAPFAREQPDAALHSSAPRLVAYDWELATLHVPQRDLAELLAFVLPPDVGESRVTEFLDLHRQAVGHLGKPEEWREGYRLALWDFAVTRLLVYVMVHTQRELPFLGRVMATTLRLIAIEDATMECPDA